MSYEISEDDKRILDMFDDIVWELAGPDTKSYDYISRRRAAVNTLKEVLLDLVKAKAKEKA